MKKIISFIKYHKVKAIYFSITIIVLVFSFIFNFYELIYVPIFFDFIYFILSKRVPLLINTPDGYNESFHPSVLYFEAGWNGYRYWMAYTPFPTKAFNSPYGDRWECPCVYSSNDGIHFDTPKCGVK